ncbi:MAG: hypothetical protein M1830_010440 [Pleopsidium flavum]|nr:MAG: hypothetical protein M1830_010440 [Pleopsidium flavum]
MSKPIILVIGSLNTDLITRTSRIPAPGETLTSHSFDTGSGGKGANQAVACARLSRRRDAVDHGDVLVRMAGAVGDDIFGHDLLEGLKRDGVDTNGVEVKKGEKTGVSTIIVEEQTGENRILFSPNANYTLKPEDFTSLQQPLPDVIVLQLEIPLDTVLQVLKTACEKGVHVIFNPAPAIPLPDEAYRCITHLIVNESEAAILSGETSGQAFQPGVVQRIADHFRSLGVQNIIVTLGSKGVFYSGSPGKYGDIPAEKAKVVDTTAAGDTFVGAYAVEVARHVGKGGEFDVADTVKLANRAAAKTVERRGAQAAIPWMNELST